MLSPVAVVRVSPFTAQKRKRSSDSDDDDESDDDAAASDASSVDNDADLGIDRSNIISGRRARKPVKYNVDVDDEDDDDDF